MLVDLLLPQRCAVCRTHGCALCPTCMRSLPRIRPPLCARCGAPTAWPVARCRECAGRRLAFASARAAVAYEDCVRRLVAEWKEHGLRSLAAVAADVVAEELERPAVDAVVAVPADPDRRLRRGDEPARRLAEQLARRWSLPLAEVLARPRARPRQRGLDLAERRRNVRGTFAATRPPPRRLALVDDVYTSGATAAEAASALRKAGARDVRVVTFARAIRGR